MNQVPVVCCQAKWKSSVRKVQRKKIKKKFILSVLSGKTYTHTELAEFLVTFVVEQTGYPSDIVELDADLEADLGIDSIKKAQLFGEIGEYFSIPPRADLSLDAFPTLQHVLDFLVDATCSSQVAVRT